MAFGNLSQEFVWKRLHSLMGLWLVLFIMEHLFVNSQAALLLGGNAKSFVDAVNSIHNLPYLPAIELFLLGVPILIHLVWGLKILWTAKSNASSSNGSKPALRGYKKNHAYAWQRISSWILLVGLSVHVVQMRFLDYPWSVSEGPNTAYFVKIQIDPGLESLTKRLGFTIYDKAAYEKEKDDVGLQRPLKEGEVIAATSSFGTASLLTVRDTFKSPVYALAYTIFVLAACFHGFNGLWTFLITWGAFIKVAAQKRAAVITVALMLLLSCLGLAAIWGSYWGTLR